MKNVILLKLIYTYSIIPIKILQRKENSNVNIKPQVTGLCWTSDFIINRKSQICAHYNCGGFLKISFKLITTLKLVISGS